MNQENPNQPSSPSTASAVPDLVPAERTSEEEFLRQIFVRAQMTQFVKEPFIAARADGVYYWDVRDKRYLDAISGIYVVSVGHNNRTLIDAIRKQMDVLHFSPTVHGTNPLAVQLANQLAKIAPGDLEAAKLLSGGSEATEAAITMARQYHRLNGKAGKFLVKLRA